MRIIVFNVRKMYAVKTAAKIVTVLFALVLSCVFVLEHILDSSLYVSASTESESGKIIIIDAGHGGEDCGAIGKNGAYEKALNLQLASELYAELTTRGYTVVMTRTEDKMLYAPEENVKGIRKISDLKNRVKIAEEYPDALFISIHMNTYAAERYHGFQAYFNSGDPNSQILADTIQKTVRTTLQPDNGRAIKDGGELYILKNAPTTTVLLECGFISNSEECEKLCEKEYQKQLSFSIVCGIIEYIES